MFSKKTGARGGTGGRKWWRGGLRGGSNSQGRAWVDNRSGPQFLEIGPGCAAKKGGGGGGEKPALSRGVGVGGVGAFGGGLNRDI